MKVFHIITHFDVGGAERVAIDISSSKSDVDYHIVEVIRGNSAYTDMLLKELEEKDIKYHRALLPVLFHWHYICEKILACLFPFRFLLLWIRYKPDVVHCHTEMPDMGICLAMRMFPFIKVRVVRTIHNSKLWTGMGIIGPRVEKMMKSYNANIAISPRIQEMYNNVYGEKPPVIYNGIAPVHQKKYEGIKEGKVNICFAGRFEEQKGIAILCEIITLMKSDTRYHFHIFGAGRQQGMIDELRTLPNVSVNGSLYGISSYMSSFDYLIMPSLHEGLAILSLEASVNGLPVMINQCVGLVETVPETWPLSVSNNDIKEWLHLFNNVLPVIDTKMLRREAQAYVTERYSLERMQRSYEMIYKENKYNNGE